jgi:hypothetical protein
MFIDLIDAISFIKNDSYDPLVITERVLLPMQIFVHYQFTDKDNTRTGVGLFVNVLCLVFPKETSSAESLDTQTHQEGA